MSILHRTNNNRKITSLLQIVFITLISFSITACDSEESDTVDQDKINTRYLLYYNANEDVTYARAWFYFSDQFGQPLELVSPSKVTFNGDELPWRETLSYYEKQYAGYKGGGTFQWTDTDGKTYTNSINTDTSIGYPAQLDTIPRNSSYAFTWTGDSLGQNESIQIKIDGENENDTQLFSQNNPGSTSIVLPKDQLQDIGHGPGDIEMDWKHKADLQEETSTGGWIKARYRPENREVYMD